MTVGHNKFSDWTVDELKLHAMGMKASAEDIENMRHRYATFESDFIDDKVDWLERGAVTHVRDSGYCASSWAHAAVAAIEAAHYIDTDELVELSTQQLIDCDKSNYGCEGGLMANAFEYAEEFHLMRETDYP